MAKKFQLNIPEPCHEDWENMTPDEKGKFCGSCQKQVIDFSTMSDRELAQFFKKPSTGSVCGRFMTDQLERDLEIPKKRIPWLRYFFTMAIPAFFLSLKASAGKTQGQIRINKSDTDTSGKRIYGELKTMGMVSKPFFIRPVNKDTTIKKEKNPVCDQLIVGKPSVETIKGEIFQQDPAEKMMIKGKVVNAKGQALEAVMVQVKGKKAAVFTDKTGHFEINVITGETLDFFLIGFNSENRIINNRQSLEIVLQEQKTEMMVGAVVVTRRPDPVLRLSVQDENKQPIPFASIEMNGKAILAADHEGIAELKGKKLENVMLITVTAAGYLPASIASFIGDLSGNTQVVTLKAKEALPEVVITTNNYVMGGAMKSVRVRQTNSVPEKAKQTGLVIYPNPVPSGTQLSLKWLVTKEGYHQYRILNPAGQVVVERTIWLDLEAGSISLPLPQLPAATYWLVISNQDKSNQQSGKFVVQ